MYIYIYIYIYIYTHTHTHVLKTNDIDLGGARDDARAISAAEAPRCLPGLSSQPPDQEVAGGAGGRVAASAAASAKTPELAGQRWACVQGGKKIKKKTTKN